MELTPLGAMLLDPVREALHKIESTLSLRPDFDPAVATRRFAVCASEATVLALMAEVLGEIERQAPGVSIALLPGEPARMGHMLDARELDLLFVGENMLLPLHPCALALRDDFVCVVWKGNKLVRNKLTVQQYLALNHAVTRYGMERRPGFEEYTLDRLGVQRRVVVSCTTPALLGPLVVGTQRIATMPSRLARQQASVLPLKLLPPPFTLPPLKIHMQWHRSREQDGATVWLRELVSTVSRRLGLID
jgi:DNA-binding transcriptional LysR family regulator